ncbi:hypothetical protein [Pelotomaculum propionicicum]|uniref:Uncharacterized protein n=1 Tax=Pelotomaculum propionicicum TaxID=258475 RepID=A0A4Y7RM24_9FIRM|nr:hypothetical protein [Pelotomaculum propionicicum]NLI14559.1 hypothetical protein [Peptococcaceae bacterium]TEB10025.1 hypothetical protein Pmgp_02720 [Pelotomaculum propionicicum]
MPNFMDNQFENPIVKIDIATGRGFCKIFEVWDRDASYRSPWTKAQENMTVEDVPAKAEEVVSTTTVATPIESEKSPGGAKKKQKRGIRAERNLRGLFGARRVG